MKHIQYLLVAFGILLLTGCQKEELPAAGGYGYLAVTDVVMQASGVDVVSARSEEQPLTVEIWQDETLLETLSETDLQDKIKLEAGEGYKLRVYSSSYGQYTEWTNEEVGEPVYYAEEPFSVEAEKTTALDVKVSMINFGVRLALPEGFTGSFTYAFTVTVGNRTLILTEEQDTAYFCEPEEGMTFSYKLEVTNADQEKNTLENTYEQLEAGTLYTVSYLMEEHTAEVSE